MPQKKTEPNAAGDLKHSPFAGLAKQRALMEKAAPPPGVVVRSKAGKPAPALKVRVRLEPLGRSGKAITRITGLPQDNIQAIAARLRKALGCVSSVQEADVVLEGMLDHRAQQWLDRVGDLRAVTDEQPVTAPQPAASSVSPVPLIAPNSARLGSGTRRRDVRRGRRVAIVQKADQDTGKLTQGVVRDVLTNSDVHPRGIKVRLETGEVGRVQVIYE